MRTYFFLFHLMVFFYVSGVTAQNPQWYWQNPKPAGNDLHSVHAITSSTVVAVGELGTIIRSTDGGTSWTWIKCAGGKNVTLYDVHFPTSTYGYAVGEYGVVVKSTDGGSTWQTKTSTVTSTLYGVSFVNRDTGIA
ncbi:MAG: hypothetical protein HYZ34_04060, partial [Ignavibacteriae bacterium]|nr:hypothetical protein [Ignavibacteriota bacterium]